MILAIDPGKDKCGLAVLDEDQRVLEKKVVASAALLTEFRALVLSYRPNAIVIGEGHYGKKLVRELGDLPPSTNMIFVSEKNSTRLARQRYWQAHPPAGLWRLVPTSFRVPPVPVNDYAAVVIGENYLAT